MCKSPFPHLHDTATKIESINDLFLTHSTWYCATDAALIVRSLHAHLENLTSWCLEVTRIQSCLCYWEKAHWWFTYRLLHYGYFLPPIWPFYFSPCFSPFITKLLNFHTHFQPHFYTIQYFALKPKTFPWFFTKCSPKNHFSKHHFFLNKGRQAGLNFSSIVELIFAISSLANCFTMFS